MESIMLLHTIRQAFRHKRIKRVDVANKLDVTEKSVSCYLSGKTRVDVDTLLEMADMAGLDIIVRDRDSKEILLADNYNDNLCYEELSTRKQRIERTMKQLYELLEKRDP